MPLVSSGRPSATGAPSVVVDSMQMLFGSHVGWCPGTTPLGNIEVLKAWCLGAMLLWRLSLRFHFFLE